MDKTWIQVDIYTTTEGIEPLCSALHDIGHSSLAIADAADLEGLLEGKHGAWDYIDHNLMKLREAETTVTVYLPHGRQGQESLNAILEALSQLKALDSAGEMGRLECAATSVKDEDWATSWRKHYEPVAIGEKLIIRPSWEGRGPDPEGRIALRLDPGMAFGTGIDETTQLCLEALENAVEEGCSVLDIGCGSGILAIGALLLGAGSALGVDIDQVAVNSASENAKLNGVSDRSGFICGNLAERVTETYDIACANITADAIVSLAPDVPSFLRPGGLLILSGIIENRETDVTNAIASIGFSIKERTEQKGWVCIVSEHTGTVLLC